MSHASDAAQAINRKFRKGLDDLMAYRASVAALSGEFIQIKRAGAATAGGQNLARLGPESFAVNDMVVVMKVGGVDFVMGRVAQTAPDSWTLGGDPTDHVVMNGLFRFDQISGSAATDIGDTWIESALGLLTTDLETGADSRFVTVPQKVSASSALAGSTILTNESAFDTFASFAADAIRKSGKYLRIRGYATYHVGASGATLRFKLRLNDGTNQYVIYDSGTVSVAIGTDGVIIFDVSRNQTSTGTSNGWGVADFAVSGAPIATKVDTGNGSGTGPSASTTAKIEATVQFSVANSGNTATLQRMVVEVF